MKTVDTGALLASLLACHARQQTLDVLRRLGDDDSVGIDQPFGQYGVRWLPFGDNPSNISTIGLATKPGKSLTERITNAMDALLEERAELSTAGSFPESPQKAAEEWFGRPMSGPDSGLFQGLPVAVDKRISIVLIDSGVDDGPTVDVIDHGVGIDPADLRGTILSLQAGNKIKKRHQIGAFGQGGSSTLGFSDFVLIVSRPHRDMQTVGFTVIRVMKLDASYKEDCYAFLANSEGQPFSTQMQSAEEVIRLYPFADKLNPPDLTKGTLVRHIGYRLSGVSKTLTSSPGNLYHYLHYSLFDPLLPFRIWDLRLGPNGRSEYVGGSRNRLMRLSSSAKAQEGDKADKVQIKHYRPMEYIVPSGADVPCIGIEYWVVLAFRKGKEGEEDRLRPNSVEQFVQPYYPIVGTMNGQTQGELTGQMFKEISLGLLAKHTIVHIDASAADSRVRRELFATSREGFKEGPVLDSITSSLRRMLEEDEELVRIEAELTERLSKRDNASTRDAVRQQVTRLLKEAGLQVSEAAKADVEGQGERRVVTRLRRTPYRKRDPLHTLPFPNATYVRFAWPDQHLEVHLHDSELVLVETDADAEFDRRNLIGIASTESLLEIESKANLSGGRIRWRLRPSKLARAGVTGELRVFLNKPNGTQLSASISFEVLPPREKPAKPGKSTVPPFEIQPISPADVEKWDTLWATDGADQARQERHAYIAHEHGGKTWVYYSTIFPAFSSTIEKLKVSAADLVEPFTTAYEVWIAYHAILQKQAEESFAADLGSDEKLEELLDVQRAVVATMQVKQAQQYAELWKKGVLLAHAG